METDTQQARPPWLLARRSDDRELLDLGRVTGDELRTNLSDLARLNRLPGGVRASVAAIRRLVDDDRSPVVLDIGTGSGDMPAAFAKRGWQVLALDADPEVAEVARARTAGSDRIQVVHGDAGALPFGDGSVDVAHASLLLHHFDPSAAVGALSEMGRVARRGVVINDLRRGVLPLVATAGAVVAFGRCRTTRHDGLLSVRRAYTLAELEALLAKAGLRSIHRSWTVMPRVVTIAVAGRP